jgi:DNA-binding Lrp family transcriptional regulator
MAEVNTGYVRFVPEDRDRICKKLNMQRANLSRSVGNLLKAGVIEGSTTYFRIRPELFWKGTTEKRAEVLRERGISVEVSFVIGADAQKKALEDVKNFEDAGK